MSGPETWRPNLEEKKTTTANEPAFPCEPQLPIGCAGLTKREYFAAMAMQGLCSTSFGPVHDEAVPYRARLAVRQADALLAELERAK